MATYDELMDAARRAHAAGDVTAARRFVARAKQAKSSTGDVAAAAVTPSNPGVGSSPIPPQRPVKPPSNTPPMVPNLNPQLPTAVDATAQPAPEAMIAGLMAQPQAPTLPRAPQMQFPPETGAVDKPFGETGVFAQDYQSPVDFMADRIARQNVENPPVRPVLPKAPSMAQPSPSDGDGSPLEGVLRMLDNRPIDQSAAYAESVDPFANEGAVSLLKRRGQQVATGLSQIASSTLRGIGQNSAIGPQLEQETAPYYVDLWQGRMKEATDALASGVSPKTGEPLTSREIASFQSTQKAATYQLDRLAKITSAPPIDPNTGAFADAGSAVDRTTESLVGKPDPRDTGLWAQLAQGLGSMLGFAAASIGTGGNPIAVATLGNLSNADSGYQDAKQAGASDTAALQSSAFNGLLGMSEAIPIERALHALPAKVKSKVGALFGDKLVSILQSSGEEALQEFVQQVGQNLNAIWNYDQNRSATDGAGTNALIGALLGGGMAVGGMALNGGKKAPAIPAVAPAEKQPEQKVPETAPPAIDPLIAAMTGQVAPKSDPKAEATAKLKAFAAKLNGAAMVSNSPPARYFDELIAGAEKAGLTSDEIDAALSGPKAPGPAPVVPDALAVPQEPAQPQGTAKPQADTTPPANVTEAPIAGQAITEADALANPDRYEILDASEGTGSSWTDTGTRVVLDTQTGQVYPLAPSTPAQAVGATGALGGAGSQPQASSALGQSDAVPPAAEITPEQSIAAAMGPKASKTAPAKPVAQIDSAIGKTPTSWVIRNKETGEVVLETSDKAKVNALNTAKYEAVPIGDHLASINGKPKDQAAAPTPQQGAVAVKPIPTKDIPHRVVRSDTAMTPTGTPVKVDYAIVSLDSLTASNSEDGRINPKYPQERQPRDRTDGKSEQQIQRIMRDFDPRQLDESPTTDNGAPIVDAAGIVESGNGRTMMFNRIYRDRPDLAKAYQDHLRTKGYPIDGVKNPVLVRIRRTDMTNDEISGYTRDSNTDTKLSMSATEQAIADASALPDAAMSLYRGGDIDAAANRGFVTAFNRHVVPENEQGTMIDQNTGAMSQEAVRRISGAMLAKAYGDAELINKLIEAADNNIKSIGGALLDVSPAWAKMRAAARDGSIAPEMDQTAALIEAVKLVNRARTEGRNVIEYVKQPDLLSGDGISPMGQRFLALMFKDTRQWTKPQGRDRMVEAFTLYTDEAMASQPGADMFGATANPDATLAMVKDKQDQKEVPNGQQTDLFAKAPGRDGEGIRQTGGDGAGPGKPTATAPVSAERPQGSGQTAVGTSPAEAFIAKSKALRDKIKARATLGYPLKYTNDLTETAHGQQLEADLASAPDLAARQGIADQFVLTNGKKRKIEHFVALGKDGEFLSLLVGKKDGVEFSDQIELAAKDGLIGYTVHNHPSDRGLSAPDIRSLFSGYGPIIVVGHGGARHTAKVSKAAADSGINSAQVSFAYDRMDDFLGKKWNGMVAKGQLPFDIKVANQQFHNVLTVAMARLGLIEYEGTAEADLAKNGVNFDDFFPSIHADVAPILGRAGFTVTPLGDRGGHSGVGADGPKPGEGRGPGTPAGLSGKGDGGGGLSSALAAYGFKLVPGTNNRYGRTFDKGTGLGLVVNLTEHANGFTITATDRRRNPNGTIPSVEVAKSKDLTEAMNGLDAFLKAKAVDETLSSPKVSQTLDLAPPDAAIVKAINSIVTPENKDASDWFISGNMDVQFNPARDGDVQIEITKRTSRYEGRKKLTSAITKKKLYSEIKDYLSPEARAAIEAYAVEDVETEPSAPITYPTTLEAVAMKPRPGEGRMTHIYAEYRGKRYYLAGVHGAPGAAIGEWHKTYPQEGVRILTTDRADGTSINGDANSLEAALKAPKTSPAKPAKVSTGNAAIDSALDDLFGDEANVPSPRQPVERDSGKPAPADGVGATDVPASAGSTRPGGEQRVGADNAGNGKRDTGGRLSGGDAAALGGQGNSGVDGSERPAGKPSTGSNRGSGNGRGAGRLSSDTGRAQDAAGNASGGAAGVKGDAAARLAAIRNILKEDLIDAIKHPGMAESQRTSTPAFKAWFGDSKVVDASGRPLVVYHGTSADFEAFESDNRMVWASEGLKVPTLYADHAAYFAGWGTDTEGAGQRILPIYMRIAKPFNADLDLPKSVNIDDMLNAMAVQAMDVGMVLSDAQKRRMLEIFDIVNKARRREESGPYYSRHDFWYDAPSLFGRDGADAIREAFNMLGFDGIKMLENGEPTWGAFNPEQVKSVFNRGTWDANDRAILAEEAESLIAIDQRKYEQLESIFTDALDGADVASMADREVFRTVILPLKDAGMTREEVGKLTPYLEAYLANLRSGRVNLTSDVEIQSAQINGQADRAAMQAKADKIRPEGADEANIRATLPLLLPEQQDDVLKTERRFAKPDGHGMMITNGTGTGKTYSGGGVIKRFVQMGRGNILIVAPSEAVIAGWSRALEALGVPVSQLRDTKDAGQGVVITTYANLRDNNALATRNFDLIVTDESQNLMSSQSGDATGALRNLRALSKRPSDLRHRSRMLHADEWARFDAMKDGEIKSATYRTLTAREDGEVAKWSQEPRSKVLFLSATPFAYDKTVDYAEGYLFNYPKDGHVGNSRQSGQNLFMVQHFGYRIRYHKLTRPEAAVDSAVFEREFHEKLVRDGVLSGRSLQIDVDYDRKFSIVADGLGAEIDKVLAHIWDNGSNPDKALADGYRTLSHAINRKFNYLKRMQLLEAIKAKAAVADIHKHLAMGRKVVVFHDYNVGGGFNPFADIADMQDDNAIKAAADLLIAFPDLNKMDFTGYGAPVDTLLAAFPKTARAFNGTVPQKKRIKNLTDFNTDGSGADVLIVQADAGGAGISMHDTSGQHQRVLINLGMPTKPTTTLQEEGRILRVGTLTNAPFRYYTIGTGWERNAFAKRIAERSGTVENLALGNQARDLLTGFIDAYMEAEALEPSSSDGTGGKERDRAANIASPYDKAKTHYFGRTKTTGKRTQRDGLDFYPTPEPLAFKMVEWAGIRPNERVLEPSAGDGSIARYMPDHADVTMVEPSSDLLSTALLRTPHGKDVQSTFESYHLVNKHHVIVMNPPFGSGGKLAMEHLAKAARHLRAGGRLVALIPSGPSADKRFDAWMNGDDAKGFNFAANISLPTVAFEKAGTSVVTRVVIIDRLADGQEGTGQPKSLTFSGAKTINEFFDRLNEYDVPRRPDPVKDIVEELEAEGQDATTPLPSVRPAAPLAPQEGAFKLKDTKHSKTGQPLFVATIVDRVERDTYTAILAVAKTHGGYYSAFRGNGAVPGFQFKTEADRAAFLEDMKKPTQERPGVAETAYHGTPHDFDRFTLDKIGTGEGAQVYGWGLYFAGNRKVAEYYRRTLSRAALSIDGKPVDSRLFGNSMSRESVAELETMLTDRPPQKPDEIDAEDWKSARVLLPYELRFTGSALRDKVSADIDDPKNRLRIYRDVAVGQYRSAKERGSPDRFEYGARLAAIDWMMPAVSLSNAPRLFTVDIPGPENVLEWEAFISGQPAQVQERLAPVLEAIRKHYRGKEKALNGGLEGFMRNLTGWEVVDFLQTHGALYGIEPDGYTFTTRIDPKVSHVIHEVRMSSTSNKIGEGDGRARALKDALIRPDEYASLALRKLGIPGHRYLDGSSRNAGEGSYNYVIYDDAAIKIIEKEQVAQMTREAAASTEEITRLMPALRAELDRLDLKRVKLTQAEAADGYQGKFVVTGDGEMEIVIGASLDPAKTLHHEVIHALRAMQLFTKDEWRALTLAAERSWLAKHDIEARYPHLTRQEQIEEAIAEEFSEALDAKRSPNGSALVKAFNKIARLFRAIRNVFNGAGFHTAEDIFGKILAGEISKRQAGNTGAMTRLQTKHNDPSVDDMFGGHDEKKTTGMAAAMRREIEVRQQQSKMRKTGGNSGDAGPLFGTQKDLFGEGGPKFQRPKTIRPLTPQARAHRNSGMGGSLFIPDRRIWEELRRSGQSVWARLRNGSGGLMDAIDRSRLNLQDRFLPLLRAQSAIEKATGRPLPPEQQAYLRETTFSGVVGNHLNEIKEEYTKPIVRLIAATKGEVTAEDVGEWLYARHAIERNARIAAINHAMPDGGSGMMDAEAQQILADVAAGPHAATFNQIGTMIDALRERTLKLREDRGVITHAEANAWRSMYQHYVPLKGFAETDHVEAILGTGGQSRGYSVRGRESQRALGRESEAFNPLQAALTQAQEVAIRAEKNAVGQTVYELAKSYPSKALWEVKTPKQKKYYNRSTGMVETRVEDPLQMILEPNEMAVKVSGIEHRVIFHDQRIADAMINLGVDQLQGVVKVLGPLSRIFSMVNTTLSPAFMLKNAIRDFASAQITMSGWKESKGGNFTLSPGQRAAIMWAMTRNWRKALMGAMRGQSYRFDTVWSKHFKDFQKSGAQISFWILESPETAVVDFDRRIHLARGNAAARGLKAMTAPGAFFSHEFNPVLRTVERVNLAVDNAIRLAAFVEARNQGLNVDQAAFLAKELTVNFNRRGRYGAALNAVFPFFNAGIQGVTRLMQALSNWKLLVGVTLGGVALGLLMDIMNAALSDDDDDGMLLYDKIPDYRNRTNLQVVSGNGSTAWAMPLPYGFNVFPYAGQQIGKVMRGVKTPADAFADLFGATAQSYLPTDTLVPTIFQPTVEIWKNENFFGSSIYPEDFFGNGKYLPDAAKFFPSATEASKSLAMGLNKLTGGNEVESGYLDFSPEVIDHYMAFVVGGAGRFWGRGIDNLAKVLQGKADEIETKDIPFVSVLRSEVSPWADKDLYKQSSFEVKNARYDLANWPTGRPIPNTVRQKAALYDKLLEAERELKGQGEFDPNGKKFQRAARDEKAVISEFNREFFKIDKRYAQ